LHGAKNATVFRQCQRHFFQLSLVARPSVRMPLVRVNWSPLFVEWCFNLFNSRCFVFII
jgi:hypothetical protein